MELEFLTWSELKKQAMEDMRINGNRYAHELDVAKAWFASGKRIALHRWAMRRDFETHLVQEGKNILIVECDGAKGVFCSLSDLQHDNFLFIPDNHVIGEYTPYPEYIYGNYEIPTIRTKQ